MGITNHEEYFSVKTYLNSCLISMEASNFGKTSLSCQYDETRYNSSSETNGWGYYEIG